MVMRRGATLQEQEDGIIYARYSSHAQKDASIEQQIRECMAFAQARASGSWRSTPTGLCPGRRTGGPISSG